MGSKTLLFPNKTGDQHHEDEDCPPPPRTPLHVPTPPPSWKELSPCVDDGTSFHITTVATPFSSARKRSQPSPTWVPRSSPSKTPRYAPLLSPWKTSTDASTAKSRPRSHYLLSGAIVVLSVVTLVWLFIVTYVLIWGSGWSNMTLLPPRQPPVSYRAYERSPLRRSSTSLLLQSHPRTNGATALHAKQTATSQSDAAVAAANVISSCLLYTSPSPRD